MYAEDASNGGSQASFMAFLPDESGEEGKGRWIHGSAVISQAFIARFLIPAKTYIGQLELLAAVAVYYLVFAPALPPYPAICYDRTNSPRREPPWLNFTPTLPPQAGIIKAGAAVIECSLKAKHVLVPVMIGAAAAQRFSLSSVLSSSRS